jgi:hypothetical protein
LNPDFEIILEQFEHFPKQTYRNRADIYGANGKLSLTIPIKHNGERYMKNISVSDAENWRKQHWKSIKTAYQSSPFFEYYEDRLLNIFENEEPSLMQFNLNALKTVLNILKTEKNYSFSSEYSDFQQDLDFRNQFSAKNPPAYNLEKYRQTFSDRFGFIENLSILDLVCNKGPESLTYLKSIK